MVHHRQGLAFGLEPGDDALGLHAELDDLQRHPPAHRLLLLGHVDHAAAALPDLLEELVPPDAACRPAPRRPGSAGARRWSAARRLGGNCSGAARRLRAGPLSVKNRSASAAPPPADPRSARAARDPRRRPRSRNAARSAASVSCRAPSNSLLVASRSCSVPVHHACRQNPPPAGRSAASGIHVWARMV